ncbi:MAG: flagellar hook-length control protein FliK [Marinisporobacter sp.]|jgi:flagellar hook-length control protein FliK|nr:flagellar hook-length control protein FliK [Marinisporobacter sp.]
MMMNINMQVNSKNLLSNQTSRIIQPKEDRFFDKVLKEKINEPKEEYSKASKTEHQEKDIQRKDDKKIKKDQPEKKVVDQVDAENIEKDKKENIPEEIVSVIASLEAQVEELVAIIEAEGNKEDMVMELENIKSHFNKIRSFIEENNMPDIKENTISKEILQPLVDKLQMILNQKEVNLDLQDFNKALSQLEELLEKQVVNNEISSAAVGDQSNKEDTSFRSRKEETNSMQNTQNKENSELNIQRKDNYPNIRNKAQANTENERQMSQNNSNGEKFGFFANKTQKTVINDQLIQDISTNYTVQNNMNELEPVKLQTTTAQKPNFQNILEQVVEKAQVIMDEKGSEMTLRLKPNHLGNLSMKIAVERGIVVANIVAENQAVKEVLESNFNALRDALNEKGFGISELNVSVGQDSDFQQQQSFMNFNKRNNQKSNGNSVGYEDTVVNEQISSTSSMSEAIIDQLG